MSNYTVINGIISASFQIPGQQSTRYLKSETIFGTVPASTVTTGDYVLFPGVPSSNIIRATFSSGSTVVTKYPSYDYSTAVALSTSGSGGFDYVIEFVISSGYVDTAEVIKVHITG